MEVSYPEQAALPVERSKGFTMYREPLDYYSAVRPVFPQRLWESQEEEHCSVLHSFSRRVGFFPFDVSFFYSTYLHNLCLSPHSSVALGQ